ncbi:MAG: hypothetical protein D6679_00275 [Candidatus Hydrogenedentota bacterium]|nr:MAG: hypothetical protein D6679_00275 [Candidatus Hydrogenedentota bacterium]
MIEDKRWRKMTPLRDGTMRMYGSSAASPRRTEEGFVFEYGSLSPVFFYANMLMSVLAPLLFLSVGYFEESVIALVFGAIALICSPFLFRNALAGLRLGSARLVLSKWPLRMGEEIEVVFSREPWSPARIQRLEGELIMEENATFEMKTSIHALILFLKREGTLFGRSSGTRYCVVTHKAKSFSLPSVDLLSGSDAVARWKVVIPREGPSTFQGRFNSLQWRLKVKTVAQGVQNAYSFSHFPLVVLPEVVRRAS